MISNRTYLFIFLIIWTNLLNGQVLLEDDFSNLKPGMFSGDVVGAHTEYHYLDVTAPNGNWVVSCFRSPGSQRAWRVICENGDCAMSQTYTAKGDELNYIHPMVIAGDMLWQDYTLEVNMQILSEVGQCGVLFRYLNDRCYYFFGVKGDKAILKSVKHASSFRTANETILDEKPVFWHPGDKFNIKVKVIGNSILAELNGEIQLQARDNTFESGRVGLCSDGPANFFSVTATTSFKELQRFENAKKDQEHMLQILQEANPKMTLWKKISTEGFGVGRNVRFGDMNNDGVKDVLIGQVKHHGPKDRNSEVGCLTAITFDGDILWQSGEADPWKDHLTNDVGFQIHDLDGDSRTEVIFARDFKITIADGETGEILKQADTPINRYDRVPYNKFERILGDCVFFFDSRGTGHDSDILIKDRYQNFWVMDNNLNPLWDGTCVTGHYPFAYDLDNDGKDELAIGYSLFDDDGTLLWSKDNVIQDHCDGVAVVNYNLPEDGKPIIMNAASDEGMIFMNLDGEILKHYYLGHVQNPAVANFRDDLPGLETVSINFWGNQGIIHYFDKDGNLYYDFEPVQHGSMMLPVNWTGKSEEYYVLSANVLEGGLYDGWGRKVVQFPADGHPELCNAVLNITGDCRDEIVVWDAYEMWVYTQDDNPQKGKLYKPERNSLYNYSNYQATVSLPGWSK